MKAYPDLGFESYDRLFPNQDTMPAGGFGNLIALPFKHRARESGNNVFVDETFTPYPDQWAYLSLVTGVLSTIGQNLRKIHSVIIGKFWNYSFHDTRPCLLPLFGHDFPW